MGMPPLLQPRGRRVTASSLPFGVASRVGKFDNCDPASLVAFAASGARRGAAAAGPRCVGFLYSAMPWRLPAADRFVAYQRFAPSARKMHGDKRTKGDTTAKAGCLLRSVSARPVYHNRRTIKSSERGSGK